VPVTRLLTKRFHIAAMVGAEPMIKAAEKHRTGKSCERRTGLSSHRGWDGIRIGLRRSSAPDLHLNAPPTCTRVGATWRFNGWIRPRGLDPEADRMGSVQMAWSRCRRLSVQQIGRLFQIFLHDHSSTSAAAVCDVTNSPSPTSRSSPKSPKCRPVCPHTTAAASHPRTPPS
jgi:hypothetical protein